MLTSLLLQKQEKTRLLCEVTSASTEKLGSHQWFDTVSIS